MTTENRTNKVLRISLFLVGTSLAGMTCAQTPGSGPETVAQKAVGDVTVFAGLRVWALKWEIVGVNRRAVVPDPANPGSVVLQDVVEKGVSDTEFGFIPSVGVRYGRFLASASYMIPSDYDSKGAALGDVERKELDVNVGYHVLPEVLFSLGYKHAKFDKISRDAPGGAKFEAILLGVSASKGLTDKISLYGNAAYGIGHSKVDIPDALGDKKKDLTYRIGEIGFAYALDRGIHLTIGYRAQVGTSKDVHLGTYSVGAPTTPTATRSTDIQTTTDGFVLGLVAVF